MPKVLAFVNHHTMLSEQPTRHQEHSTNPSDSSHVLYEYNALFLRTVAAACRARYLSMSISTAVTLFIRVLWGERRNLFASFPGAGNQTRVTRMRDRYRIPRSRRATLYTNIMDRHCGNWVSESKQLIMDRHCGNWDSESK